MFFLIRIDTNELSYIFSAYLLHELSSIFILLLIFLFFSGFEVFYLLWIENYLKSCNIYLIRIYLFILFTVYAMFHSLLWIIFRLKNAGSFTVYNKRLNFKLQLSWQNLFPRRQMERGLISWIMYALRLKNGRKYHAWIIPQ